MDVVLRLSFSVHKRLLLKPSHTKWLHLRKLTVNDCGEVNSDIKRKIDYYKEKILYNTIVHGEYYSFVREVQKRKSMAFERNKIEEQTLPVSVSASYIRNLKYFDSADPTDDKKLQYENTAVFNLPYNKPNLSVSSTLNDDRPKPHTNTNWMTDYEYFDDSKLINKDEKSNKSSLTFELDEEDLFENELLDYSLNDNRFLIDPSSKVSSTPCGGCGALLHCKDISIPGFVPSDVFKNRIKSELSSLKCQRCHFLQEYNVALDLNVSPEDYVKLLEKIKNVRALVILMVDILDFPCSIWPGIMDIIGTKRPVFVVGNKIDMLPQDTRGYLQHISDMLKKSLMETALKEANVKHLALISAKTGYGIEELINNLHKIWEYKGDVYLVGCTNVGKSTLFNALIQSDYCKVRAIDLLQRATVSQWPGTTLNLLKFPILRPSNWRLAKRSQRLHHEQGSVRAETKLRNIQLQLTNNSKYGSLVGHVGKTFINPKNMDDMSTGDPFSYQMSSGFTKSGPVFGINEKHKDYAQSKWFYDTPGVVHPDQILSILTIDELMLTIPKELLRPRSFYMHGGMTLFLAGLGRVDILESDEHVLLTVFASKHLPLTVCNTKDADEIYSSFLGTELLAVPTGNSERLSRWPPLECKDEFHVIGNGWKSSSVDIVLSSSGWVSVTCGNDYMHKILPWTPAGRGIHLRTPSLLPNAIQLRGKRIRGTPAYNIGRHYVPNR